MFYLPILKYMYVLTVLLIQYVERKKNQYVDVRVSVFFIAMFQPCYCNFIFTFPHASIS